ncbi:M4 family metallopeptidase [Streptomyces sp. NPDC001922]|uniref:M4 family metallopeptidase n=1 Tax=Streptomyces sp. NPDC001922 TaxID=3364624 RepID=UPI0036BA8C4D
MISASPQRRRITAAALTATAAMVAAGLAGSASAQPLQAAEAAAQSSRDSAITHAEANVARNAAAFGFGKGQELKVKDVVIDSDGTQHVRFDRTYRGLPVVGGDLVVHQSSAGAYQGSTRASEGKVAVKSVSPTVSPKNTASNALKRADGVRNATSKPVLVVWAAEGAPRLAWQTTVSGSGAHGEPAGKVVVTDAATGRQIETYDAKHQANRSGIGRSEYTGKVRLDTTRQSNGRYALKDPKRGTVTKDARNADADSVNASTGKLFTDADNDWGDGKKFSTNRATAAVDAHANTAMTWDYYKKTFNRRGIKNDGKGATVLVHVGTKWDNAAWDDACFCMMSGDGNGSNDPEQVDLDTMGHEMTHGVTSATANLRYSGESGGLNEATSDILGTMVEWHAKNRYDKPDYLFSDQSTPPWLRRFDKPSLDGASKNYWSSRVGQEDVHHSSGVGNHWFYLASEGSGKKKIKGITYNSPIYRGSSKVTGIGNGKASKIWYRALTRYMVSTTNYKGARKATLKAAADLYGKRSKEYKTVGKAWAAVNVR